MKSNANVNIERLETALRTLREANGKLKIQVKALDSALERLHSTMTKVYNRHGAPIWTRYKFRKNLAQVPPVHYPELRKPQGFTQPSTSSLGPDLIILCDQGFFFSGISR